VPPDTRADHGRRTTKGTVRAPTKAQLCGFTCPVALLGGLVVLVLSDHMARVDDHYLRVRDYAERFNLSESAVYEKIERGEIKAIRIGKTVRIPSAEMDRYLNPRSLLE
jgi:excisionase family DNA binding protein